MQRAELLTTPVAAAEVRLNASAMHAGLIATPLPWPLVHNRRMFTLIWRLFRIMPLLLGAVAFVRSRKKNDALDDDHREALQDDIEALTVLADSGESHERRNVASETAERLRASLARQQVNKGALKGYMQARNELGETITGDAATDKRYDRKLRELRDAAGKLAGNG